MIAKALTLVGGLAGAAGLSQFPEFSQQYAQRLGGAVDELNRFVADFDKDAGSMGLSRADALSQLTAGGGIAAKRADTVTATIARQERLSADLVALEKAGPFMRFYNSRRFTDTEIAGRTWEAYKPALPLTAVGGIFAGVGLIMGAAIVGLLIWALGGIWRALFRRREGTRAA